jgi:hypothetical protein
LLALDSAALEEAGITRVLTVMASNPHKEENTPIQSNLAREYIEMRDIKTFQSHPWYQTTSAIIDSALAAGERILIHWYLFPNCLTIVGWEFQDQRLWLQRTLYFVMD